MIYPNPVESNVWISRLDNTIGDVKIELYSITGKHILSDILNNGNNQIDINLNGLNCGVYFVKISNGSKVWTENIVKTK